MSVGAYGAALIASGGAVVGSVIATVPSALLTYRRERREAALAAERAAIELRAAARLVAEELEESAARLAHSARDPESVPPFAGLSTDDWDHNRAAIARGIDGIADWCRLTGAYSMVKRFNAELMQRSTEDAALAFRELVDEYGRVLFIELAYALSNLELVVGDQLFPISTAMDDADKFWPPTGTSSERASSAGY